MSHLAIYLLALAALSPARPALALGGGLQDLAAYPKYQVDFLNDLPLAESDAAEIRKFGLTHEDQFLDLHPGSEGSERGAAKPARGAIEGGEAEGGGASGVNNGQVQGEAPIAKETAPAPRVETNEVAEAPRIKVLPMLYTHSGNDEFAPHPYLCALPSANTTASQTAGHDETVDEPEPDPEASWRALSHLDGQCLYLRLPHSWFTYAYCHNKDIRQFRELQVPHPHPEGFVPKEDPDYDAYSLGVAHPKRARKKSSKRNEVQRPEEIAPEQTATFGQSHASRYLVQRWTDGTRCDLTGKPREIEVQVYCSMTGTDMIYMVNEVAICQYVIVIHSPHLCSLPGFRPTTALDIKPAPIRCREVVPDDEFAEWAQKADERRLRLGEKDGEKGSAPEAQHAKEDPFKIQGLELTPEFQAIFDAAFGSKKTPKEEIIEGYEGEPETAAEIAADAATEGEHGSKDELYFVEWDEDTDGNRVPVDVGSVPPTEGESRRAFLERLHALIEKELKGDAGKEGSKSSESAPEPEPEAAIQRDEL